MALRLLVGPAGSGKTRRMLGIFRGHSPMERLRSVRLVMPTTEQAEQIRLRLLQDSDFAGFLGSPVCTFYDLARDILSAAGVERQGRITEMQKLLMLRRICDGIEGGRFAEVADCPSFPSALGAEVGMLKVAAIAPEDLDAALKAARPLLVRGAAERIADLVDLYRRYQNDVLRARDLHDSEGVLWRAMEVAKGDPSTLGPLSSVLLDGFGVLAPVQREFIRLLAAHCREVVVTLDYDPSRPDAFLAVRPDLDMLSSIPGAEVEHLWVDERADDSSLRRLKRSLFGAPGPLQADASVTVVEGATPYMEVALAAAEIRRLVREEGYRFSEVAMVARRMDGYRSIVESVFRDYEVPCAASGRPLLLSELAQAALLALRIVNGGWRREDVLRMLRSGSCSSCDPSVCWEIETRVRSAGQTPGRDFWLAPWGADDPTHRFRVDALTGLAGFHDALAEGGAPRISEALLALLGSFHAGLDEESLIDSSAALGAIARVCDDVVSCEAMLDEPVDIARFAELLGEGIRCARYRVPSPVGDGVALLDANSLGGREFRCLFVLGLAENVWPRQPREDPFIRDVERLALNEHLPHRLEVAEDRDAYERYLFCRATGNALERLYLCYPAGDPSGEPKLSSPYLDDVRELFPDGPRTLSRELNEVITSVLQSETISMLREATVLGCCADLDAVAVVSYNSLLAADRISADDFGWRRERPAALDDPRLPAYLASKPPFYRVTELETYGSCPYRHFCQYVLGLSGIVYEPGGLQTGSVLHTTLYRLYSTVFPDGAALPDSTEDVLPLAMAFLRDAFETDPVLADQPERLRELQFQALAETLRRFIDLDLKLLAVTEFRPKYFELEFGHGQTPRDRDAASTTDRLSLILPSGLRAGLSGKIDRVDLDSEGHALIIDYKSGACPAVSGVERGTALQPALYALALDHIFGLPAVVGSEYRSLKSHERKGLYASTDWHPSGSRARKCSPEEFRTSIETAERFAIEHIQGIRSGRIAVEPVECASYCEYGPICRFSR